MMSFVMDERLKHRLTGLLVVVSIAAIFIPAMMKKSNRYFESSVNLSIKLPPKPSAPKVIVAKEKTLFRQVKVAEVHVPPVVQHAPPTKLSKPEPITTKTILPAVPKVAQSQKVDKTRVVVAPVKKTVRKPVHAANMLKKDRYAVQLASFSQQNNAKQLVHKLQSQGYHASYRKFGGKQGELYKVVVGQMNQMSEAQHLQKQLFDKLKLNGFVIKTA